MAGKGGRPMGYVVPEDTKDKISQKALARHQGYRELKPILEAIDAGDERRALRLVRELMRARKQEAA